MEREPCGGGCAVPAQQKTRGSSERGRQKRNDRKQDGRGHAIQKNKGVPQA